MIPTPRWDRPRSRSLSCPALSTLWGQPWSRESHPIERFLDWEDYLAQQFSRVSYLAPLHSITFRLDLARLGVILLVCTTSQWPGWQARWSYDVCWLFLSVIHPPGVCPPCSSFLWGVLGSSAGSQAWAGSVRGQADMWLWPGGGHSSNTYTYQGSHTPG